MDRAHEVLANTSARWNGSTHTWTFPSSATLTFGYMDSEHDRFRYQGSEFHYIGFDELTQFKERDYRFMFSRRRRTYDSQVPLRMRAGTNPGGVGHLWVKKRFDPEGRRKPVPSRRFVRALVDDNPYLNADEYRRTSLSELDSQTRKQYEEGDWTDFGGEHYHPERWPRYQDFGDAYRIWDGPGRWRHIRKAECSRLLTLDWAMGKPKKDQQVDIMDDEGTKSDCTAFTVADMTNDADALLFFLDCVNEKIPLPRNAPRLAEMCRRWRPIVVGAEDDNMTETMNLECRRFRDIPTIKPMRIGSKNKLTRSQAAIVRAERGKMLFPEIHQEWMDTMSDQLSSFTGADGEPDDVADTVATMGRLADEFRPGEDRDGSEWDAELGSEGYEGIGGWGVS